MKKVKYFDLNMETTSAEPLDDAGVTMEMNM